MTTTISPGGKTSLGGAVTVSEKKPLDDDTRETRVLEIEKLFDAADPHKRGYLDRCTSPMLCTAMQLHIHISTVWYVLTLGVCGLACSDDP